MHSFYRYLSSKRFTYFLVSILFITAAIVYSCERSIMKSRTPIPANAKLLRIAFPYPYPVLNLDPHRIETLDQAVLSQPLNSRLINLFNDGQIQGEIASEIYWNGEAYELTIREYKTHGGLTINAEDVYFSLMRILLLNNNTHGSLRSFICPNAKLSGFDDHCDGLSLEGKKIIIKPIQGIDKSHVIKLLASTDYSIIPKNQLDLKNPRKLNLDLRNTTGLYYLESDQGDGNFELSINAEHFHYKPINFHTLKFIHVPWKDDPIDFLNDGRVDYVTTAHIVSSNNLKQLRQSSMVYKSHPVKLYSIGFSPNAIRKYDENIRLAVGNVVRERLRMIDDAEGSAPTDQFFPQDAEGQLSEEQLDKIKYKINHASENIDLSPYRFSIVVYRKNREQLKKLFSDLPFIEITDHKFPWMVPLEEQPDLFMISADSSFFANISLISYYFNMEFFGEKQEGQDWVSNYIKIEDRSARLRALQQLHYKFLSEGRIFPAYFSSYIAISNVPMNIGLSKHFASNPFYLLTAKPNE